VRLSLYKTRLIWDAQADAVRKLAAVGVSHEDISRITDLPVLKIPIALQSTYRTDPDDLERIKAREWKELFHTVHEILTVPPVEFAIRGFLQEDGVSMIGGLPGHGKTLMGMSLIKALLSGAPLFGYDYFKVRKASRVLYLSPEVSLGPLAKRLRMFNLIPFVENGTLFVRSLGAPEVPLTDEALLDAAEGADVVLDTAARFITGEENSATEQKVLSQNLFALLNAGARTVTALHHSGKGSANVSDLTLENALRGSGEIGAMLSCAWAIRQVDAASTRIFVSNIKARDFEACPPFVLEGRPYIDQTGDFKMVQAPGDGAKLSDHAEVGGRPTTVDPDAGAEINRLRTEGKSEREIAKTVGLSKTVIHRFLHGPKPGPVQN